MPTPRTNWADFSAVYDSFISSQQVLKNKEKKDVKIIDPDDGFEFGNCAVKAISRCFKVKSVLTETIFGLVGAKYDDGCTWRECDRCIDSLCRIKGNIYRYTTNKTHITPLRFVKTHKKGKYLLNFPNHLCFISNGIVYDSFLTEWGFKSQKLMGWWELSK
jgi:hypothetical protein